jgi:GT2 family glycosyltransferase
LPAALTVIVVNWNTAALLRECLRSVARETAGLPHRVIVVDNASTDGSAAMVRAEFPEVELIAAEANLGYAGGNNRALPLVGGEYVALLNPDTVVEDRALERLVAFLDAHPAAGAVGPRLRHPAGRYAIENGGWQPAIGTLFAHYSGLSRLLPGRVRGLHLIGRERRRVEWLSGACLVARSAAARAAGPLLEEWFMYAEDVEWCDRLAARGWELWFEPGASVLHLDRQATGQRGATFSTLWAQGLHRHYVRRSRPDRLRVLLFDAILSGGLLSRAAIYGARAMRRPAEAHWRAEARSFVRAAGEIARLGLAR